MKRLKRILTISMLSCFCMSYAVHATEDSMTYKNQRNSIMTLIWHHEKNNVGTLSGTFTTAVGDCKQDMNVPVPVNGFFNGNAIAIVVNFPHCKQVVAMTGVVSNDDNTLQTFWLDAKSSQNARDEWKSNIIGVDKFVSQ
jgi:hypothetical protein